MALPFATSTEFDSIQLIPPKRFDIFPPVWGMIRRSRHVLIFLYTYHIQVRWWCTAVCVCVCVFFPLILDIKFVRRTSRGHTGGRSHRISHPPSFCGACPNFSREEDSAIPFLRRPCSRILCTNDLIVLRPLAFLVLVFNF